MKVDIELSKNICEQLALDLIREEAEVMKHEAAISSIKKLIVEKKEEVIKTHTDYRLFYMDRKVAEVVYIDLGTGFFNNESIGIEAYLAVLPSEIPCTQDMTSAETKLLEQYKNAFNVYHKNRTKENGLAIAKLAMRLHRLKHRIRLYFRSYEMIDFDDIAGSGFFEKTDIMFTNTVGYKTLVENMKYYR